MLVGILGHSGEVGSALCKCYQDLNIDVHTKDLNDKDLPELQILNICIPYTENFETVVCSEIQKTAPLLTIIHSTVKPGTTKSIASKTSTHVVHSPIRGSHPDLYRSLKMFVKYIGADNNASSLVAEKHFEFLKIPCKVINSSLSTEIAKLLCTTYYGLCIAWHASMKSVCDKNSIDFSFIDEWNRTYNNGYAALDNFNVIRPTLTPPENGKIGGHCIIPNAELLQTLYSDTLIETLLQYK